MAIRDHPTSALSTAVLVMRCQMRKKLFVVVLAGVALVGAVVLAPGGEKGRPCPKHYTKLRCVSGRIVCCPPGMLCDCGTGFAGRPAGNGDLS